MSQPAPWMKYLGLPYRIGADPEEGVGCDCIHLVLRVLAMGGLNPPDVERRWYNYLATKEIDKIMLEWFELTEQTYGPEDYAMTVLPSATDFSIAVVVNQGLLTVRPSFGVTWVPLTSMQPMNYRRLRHE